MKVLLTNDDGYHSEGLKALAEAFRVHHDVYIAAPFRQQSGAGHSMHVGKKMTARKVEIPGAIEAWAVDGSPVDSVKFGLEKRFPGIDFVVSGINRGANVGTDVFYSGTVGAACEAAIFGIPALAVSLNSFKKDARFETAAQMTCELFNAILSQGEREFLLNFNVPALPPEDIKGVKTARLGIRRYHNVFSGLDFHQEERVEFMLGGVCEEISKRPDDDVVLLRQGYATLTPLSLEQTCFPKMDFCKRLTGEGE